MCVCVYVAAIADYTNQDLGGMYVGVYECVCVFVYVCVCMYVCVCVPLPTTPTRTSKVCSLMIVVS
jgi:hypothetical protein